MNRTHIQSTFVLGSTSTVAIAICLALARQGCRHFHLVARNSSSNQALAHQLRQLFGAEVSLEQLDLLAENPEPPCLTRSFDLYLITAGALGNADEARLRASEALAITAANYTSLIPWLTAIVTPERIQTPGRLWVFSSVAADRGRPSNYHYGAAKAALTSFCEGLMLRCQGTPFAVRILKAGFIATPMTIGKTPAALCAKPDQIARDLLRRPNRRGIEYIPWWWAALMMIVRLLPPALAAKL